MTNKTGHTFTAREMEALTNWENAIKTGQARDMRTIFEAMLRRELALRNIKAVHTRFCRGEMTAENAVDEMEAIAVSVWQQET